MRCILLIFALLALASAGSKPFKELIEAVNALPRDIVVVNDENGSKMTEAKYEALSPNSKRLYNAIIELVILNIVLTPAEKDEISAAYPTLGIM